MIFFVVGEGSGKKNSKIKYEIKIMYRFGFSYAVISVTWDAIFLCFQHSLTTSSVEIIL